MSLVGGVVLFVSSWWLIFFMLLPVGVQRDSTPVPGNDPGAPRNLRLKRKMVLSTLASGLIVFLGWGLLAFDLVSLRP